MDRTRLLYAELCAYCNHQIHSGCIRPGQLPPLAWRVVEELTYRVEVAPLGRAAPGAHARGEG